MQNVAIREVVSGDLDNLKSVIDSSELFPSEFLNEMIEGYLKGTDESICLTADSEEPTLVAYCAQEKMTEGTWNLYLIAVHKSLQGQGFGRKVLAHLENLLRGRKGRILIVETSGLPEFELTRKFYERCNYTREARIRDFYQQGEDKIVFWKAL